MSDLQFGALVALVLVVIAMKVGDFVVVRGYLREAAEVLEMAKSYYELGRSQHSDARRVMDDVKTHTGTVVGEVARAVAPVPKATAAEVIQRMEDIKLSESGTTLQRPPLSPPDRPATGQQPP